MDTVIRKQASFRLRRDLLECLSQAARRNNRSLNNYVESLLMKSVYPEPNKETLEAMREAKSGSNLESLDLDNFDEFVKSL